MCQSKLLHKQLRQLGIGPWPRQILALHNDVRHEAIVPVIGKRGAMLKGELAEQTLLDDIVRELGMDAGQLGQTLQADRAFGRKESLLAARTAPGEKKTKHFRRFLTRT